MPRRSVGFLERHEGGGDHVDVGWMGCKNLGLLWLQEQLSRPEGGSLVKFGVFGFGFESYFSKCFQKSVAFGVLIDDMWHNFG